MYKLRNISDTVLKWLSKAKSGYLDYFLICVIMKYCYHGIASPLVNKGGFELSPVLGHLDSGELITEPSLGRRGQSSKEAGGSCSNWIDSRSDSHGFSATTTDVRE